VFLVTIYEPVFAALQQKNGAAQYFARRLDPINRKKTPEVRDGSRPGGRLRG
jgi:hypothetical protein